MPEKPEGYEILAAYLRSIKGRHIAECRYSIIPLFMHPFKLGVADLSLRKFPQR